MRALRSTTRAPIIVGVLLAAGCGSPPAPSTSAPSTPEGPSSGPAAASGPTAADAAFVRHMLPHHRRAIEVGALAATRGADPRVRDFGRRIMAEQTPEEQRLTGWVTALGLIAGPGDAMAADGYVADATLARLRTEPVAAFDRDVLLTSADSEAGAATMARAELDDGTYAPARELATSISTAPNGEIPELRALAAQLR